MDLRSALASRTSAGDPSRLLIRSSSASSSIFLAKERAINVEEGEAPVPEGGAEEEGPVAEGWLL